MADRVAPLAQLTIDCLNTYGGGFAELERLDRDLKSKIRSLSELANSSRTQSLIREWGQLEIICASTLADGQLYLSQDDEKDVQDIVARLSINFAAR
jgi:hypothetical protein